MRLRQLSLFLENQTGKLRAPCEALGKAGVNILAMSLADTSQFGILRLVVSDWARGKAALEAGGTTVKVTEVVPVEVEDRPGGLARVLAVVDEAGLSIEYMYALAAGPRGGKTTVVFRFDEPERATAVLQGKGLRVLDEREVLGST
jgi:hypothetical protein